MVKQVAEQPNSPAVREEQTRRDDQCRAVAESRGQMRFTLIEQDISTPIVIAEWIKQNIMTCTPSKLHDALETALAMRDSSVPKKAAD